MQIELQEVSKQFGTQWAVRNISFTLKQGEITGFLGPNGAGKSTTMKMITSFLKPTQGRILWNGQEVAKNRKEFKHILGYLPEQNPLYADLYVQEYLHFMAQAYKIKQAEKHIQQLIQKTGIEKEKHKKLGQLSKGYKQRVGLAAAIIHNPSILILDEPTSGLDPIQSRETRALIQDLAKDKLLLFSSHLLNEVDALCNRVIVIHLGQLMANDTLSNLKTKLQLQAQQQSLRVQFNKPIAFKDLGLKLKEGDHIQQISSDTLQIHSTRIEELQRELMQVLVKQKLQLQSIYTQEINTEDIFKNLIDQFNQQ